MNKRLISDVADHQRYMVPDADKILYTSGIEEVFETSSKAEQMRAKNIYDSDHSRQLPLLDQSVFRSVMGQFSTGVTVVTTSDEECYHGLTVSSFCSLSLTPSLVLVCIDDRTESYELIHKTGMFAVNILAEGCEGLARQFASHTEDKFANVSVHRGAIGMPLLDEALATLECQLCAIWPGGDHGIFVGLVQTACLNRNVGPLLYHKSNFHVFAEDRSE